MSDYWNTTPTFNDGQEQDEQDRESSVETVPGPGLQAEAKPEAATPARTRKRTRPRSRKATALTRAVVEDVLDRFERYGSLDADVATVLAGVYGLSDIDARSLTLAVLTGEARHRQGLDDLLTIAQADQADRDMVALTIGMEGMKRLKTAFDLAASVGLTEESSVSTNPITAARQVACAAALGQETFETVRGLI